MGHRRLPISAGITVHPLGGENDYKICISAVGVSLSVQEVCRAPEGGVVLQDKCSLILDVVSARQRNVQGHTTGLAAEFASLTCQGGFAWRLAGLLGCGSFRAGG
ncbi:hypothetical protein JCM9803A_01330 [Rhodococcus erythropolis]